VSERVSTALFTGGLAVAIVTTVLSLGLTFPLARLVAPLRRVRLVAAVVVLNTLLLPALAWAVATTAPIGPGYAAGLALAAIGSAGAAGLKAAQLSQRADLPLAVSLVVLLQVANLVAVPLWAAAVVAGASLDRLRIVQSLLLLVLLPLVAGAVVRARSDGLAARLRPALVRVANVALVVAVVTGIAANRDLLLSVIGSWVLPAALGIAVLGLGLGLLVGIGDGPTRITISLISGTRFSALGLIIVATEFPGRDEVLAPALMFTLVDFVVMIAVAVGIRRVRPHRRPRAGSRRLPG
jgi:BASS family bile acid:Na+ symporter